MGKSSTLPVLSTDLQEHQAVKAWSEICSESVEPKQIVVLKERDKSRVYRLEKIKPLGSVVAKQCYKETAELERFLYAQIFPKLPVSTLSFYGYVDEPDSEFSWLFLEDGGENAYSWEIPQHSLLATEWLSLLHTSSWNQPWLTSLPDRGPNYYLDHLHTAREKIIQSFPKPEFNTEDIALLKTIITKFEVIESHWDEVLLFCAKMPKTLVHGDFSPRNIRVCNKQDKVNLLPFDWEIAGCGVPAVDLAKCPDIDTYWSLTQEHWLHLDEIDIYKLKLFGEIFRLIISISWDSISLYYKMMNIDSYDYKLGNSMVKAGWEV